MFFTFLILQNKLFNEQIKKGIEAKINLKWNVVDQEITQAKSKLYALNIFGNISMVEYVEIQILNARNLMKADRFGLSDPVK